MILTFGTSELEMQKFDIDEHIDYKNKLDKCLKHSQNEMNAEKKNLDINQLDIDIPSIDKKHKTIWHRICRFFGCL